MRKFLADDFLLSNSVAIELYEECKDDPIYDYHSHLSAEEIYENKRFKNISEAWLYWDHYKWRQMRTVGIDEKYVTGDGDDLGKFKAYAKALDYSIGNPLYHWSHLELKRLFGIDDILTERNAEDIYNRANQEIEKGNLDVRTILENMNVKMIGTTDDICSDLKFHKLIKADASIDLMVLPTFRPDRFIIISDNYLDILKDLENCVEFKIDTLDSLKKALKLRLDYFESVGCRISDHGISEFKYTESDDTSCAEYFTKLVSGAKISLDEITKLQSNLLEFLFCEYHQRDWASQLHIGALRDVNKQILNTYGTDAGCDAISDYNFISDLGKFLTNLSASDNIGKILLYNLNPRENYALAALANSYQRGPTKGLIQFGSAWWFGDQKYGMEQQLKVLSVLGSLRLFVGMLTDSRSFLSFVRHEYFRRILANYIGTLVEDGEFPNDKELLKSIMHEICYKNNVNYFNYEGSK
ncbi:MAG: glucuronate isomerase [Anaerorhabdus sp.]